MHLSVGVVWVSGALLAGSPTCRLSSSITLTFLPMAGVDLASNGIQVAMRGKGRKGWWWLLSCM